MGEVERIVRQNILYDFYGELLTEHQRQIYEDAIFNDLSLSEISENYGITRQGAHDVIKRCDKALSGYEEKLHLIERFENVRGYAKELKQVIAALGGKQPVGAVNSTDQQEIRQALELIERILNGI